MEEIEAAGGDDATRVRMLDFARRHPDALWRTCLAGHFTASAVVIDPATDSVLLLRHAKLGRWLQPGGHADGDGDLAGVAAREVNEESGLEGIAVAHPAVDLDIHRIPARGDEPAHDHYDVRYLMICTDPEALQGNHESTDIGWFRADDPIVDGDLRRLVDAGFARL